MKYDVIVIGTGPGGYHAAIRSAQLGLSTLAVEKGDVGGVCLNRGCIPTKFMLHISKFINEIESMKKNGVDIEGYSLDMEKIGLARDRVVRKLVKGVEFLFRKNGVELLRGEARVVGKGEVEVDGRIYTADSVVIATGSTPVDLPNIGRDGKMVVYGEEVLFLKDIPESVCIVGAGATGIEMAEILNSFGSRVHVVEIMDRILPGMDRELTDTLRKALVKKGIDILTSTVIESVDVDERVKVNIGDRVLEVDLLVISAGRRPVSEYVDIVEKDEKGYIRVDGRLMTSVEGVYAIGDVVGPPLLAHKAMHQGVAVAEIIGGVVESYREPPIPYVVYTAPSIFSIGVSDLEVGDGIKVGRFPFSASGMASVLNRLEGFVKVVLKDDVVRGVHIVGEDAYGIGGEALVYVGLGLNAEDLLSLMHPHPTLTEALYESLANAYGKAIHIVN